MSLVIELVALGDGVVVAACAPIVPARTTPATRPALTKPTLEILDETFMAGTPGWAGPGRVSDNHDDALPICHAPARHLFSHCDFLAP